MVSFRARPSWHAVCCASCPRPTGVGRGASTAVSCTFTLSHRLPPDDRFCVQCADEEGTHLRPEVALLLDVCDPRDAPRTQRGARHVPTLSIAVCGTVAEPLIRCSVHAYLHNSEQRAQAHAAALARTAAPAAHVLHIRVQWAQGAYHVVE